jgi:hypothetical protein
MPDGFLQCRNVHAIFTPFMGADDA